MTQTEMVDSRLSISPLQNRSNRLFGGFRVQILGIRRSKTSEEKKNDIKHHQTSQKKYFHQNRSAKPIKSIQNIQISSILPFFSILSPPKKSFKNSFTRLLWADRIFEVGKRAWKTIGFRSILVGCRQPDGWFLGSFGWWKSTASSWFARRFLFNINMGSFSIFVSMLLSFLWKGRDPGDNQLLQVQRRFYNLEKNQHCSLTSVTETNNSKY